MLRLLLLGMLSMLIACGTSEAKLSQKQQDMDKALVLCKKKLNGTECVLKVAGQEVNEQHGDITEAVEFFSRHYAKEFSEVEEWMVIDYASTMSYQVSEETGDLSAGQKACAGGLATYAAFYEKSETPDIKRNPDDYLMWGMGICVFNEQPFVLGQVE